MDISEESCCINKTRHQKELNASDSASLEAVPSIQHKDDERWKAALQSMIKVNEGFKVKGSDILPYKGREKQWTSLQDVLQGDHRARLRIQYYKQIATVWMSGVNVLTKCSLDEPLLPIRTKNPQAPLRSPVQGYFVEHKLERRPEFPEPPSGFAWCDQRTPNKKRATSDPLGAAPEEDNTKASTEKAVSDKLQGLMRQTRSTKRRRLVLSIAPAGTGFIKLEKFVRGRKILKRPAVHQPPVPQQTLARKLIRKAKGALKRKGIEECYSKDLEESERKTKSTKNTATGRNDKAARKSLDAMQQPEEPKMPDGGTPNGCEQLCLTVDEVLSAAGGIADRCEHVENGVRCSGEAHAVCPACWVVLCNTHFADATSSCCHEHNPLMFCPCMLCELSRQ